MRVKANGIVIEVEDSHADGSAGGRPVVLLVMGLGMQLVAWPPAFVQGLVDAGYRVIRFDNRDIGLSQHFDELGVPNLMLESLKHRIGLGVRHPYTLRDMAGDALGVLDALGVAQAHVVGVSMGGMIAQRLTLTAPSRVSSLTSIMSSSGDRRLPGPKSRVLRAMLSRPDGSSEAAVVEHYVRLVRLIGSPAYPVDDQLLRERLRMSTRRSYHPAGTVRQMVAIAADSGRAVELARITAPTLVLHGRDDPLVPHACGEDTARRIPGARLISVPGMGHDLPPGVVERIMPPILEHLSAADSAVAA